MTKPKVSIIILNWNGLVYLKDCLESVLRQTYQNYDVIFVDNASTDGSVEYVRKHFPDVRIIVNSKNLGFAEGNNIGIRKSNGEYIVLLNPDTKVRDDFLEKIISYFVKDKKIGILCPTISQFNGLKMTGTTFNWLTAGAAFSYETTNHVKEWDYVTGAAMCVRKDVFDTIGVFDSRFFMYYEDMDLCTKAKRAGWKIVTIPDVLVWHKVGGIVERASSARKTYYLIRNRIWFMTRYASKLNLMFYFIIVEPLTIAAEIINLISGKGQVFFYKKFKINIWLPRKPYIVRNRKELFKVCMKARIDGIAGGRKLPFTEVL